MLMETWGMIFIILSVIYYSIQSEYSLRVAILMFSVAVTCLHYGTICYLASEISNESEKVSVNCNSVSWWNWMPGFELDISIMSTRARDPLYLKAGPFYKLNLKTFLTILKLSVTYLLILLQFNK
ncbi:uncharacterized protein LOC132198333 [Neocloeon triangulifer]|uniref:uncharacterized protein LOC132198333 n=1 Tax=Neocloeon triangulifer TaxID=2078957 RepID=UPI00286F5A96|nr:uncharacterized protein LOC132198333 [Neocloeon triangulifer]